MQPLRTGRVVALDARNGKVVWDTRISEKTPDFTNTSGPIVIKGKVIQGLAGCILYHEEKCFISAYDSETGNGSGDSIRWLGKENPAGIAGANFRIFCAPVATHGLPGAMIQPST